MAQITARHEELASLMSQTGLNGEDFTSYSVEYAELTPVVEAWQAYQDAVQEKADLKELMNDQEMRAMAAEELKALDERIPALEQKLRKALIPRDEADTKNAVLEIRAGTGGDEAALFAGDLFAMYKNYCSAKNWSVNVMSVSESEVGGYKEIICEIAGRNVYEHLKYESGTHRVQRVPKTESGGRIHTSAATVAVLPEAEEVDVTIDDKDLRVDTFRSQGAGGQHVTTTDSAVRITHMPSGIVVEMQEERSQHKNRDKAMRVLRTRLYDAERQKLTDERSEDRKSQVGSGDRSERIRTYNFPQGRVTDHRINLTLYKLEEVLRGEALDEIVEALTAEDHAAALAEIETL